MLSDDVQTAIGESVLCWLATVDDQGVPNVSPKEMFVAHGDNRLLVANIASPQSVANVRANPNVCVSFVHVFKQKGFKLKGTARIVEKNDPDYSSFSDRLYSLGGEAFDIRSVFEVTVTECAPIVAPSYWLFPDTTEASQIASAMKSYKVAPRPT